MSTRCFGLGRLANRFLERVPHEVSPDSFCDGPGRQSVLRPVFINAQCVAVADSTQSAAAAVGGESSCGGATIHQKTIMGPTICTETKMVTVTQLSAGNRQRTYKVLPASFHAPKKKTQTYTENVQQQKTEDYTVQVC